jgi:transcriptional regulator with XRE-family HTH domain
MTAELYSLTPNRMSPAEYDAERAKLAATKAEAGVRWEQELAKLFARSGWTQQELAAKENKTQAWVNQRLCFGRFLEFTRNITAGYNLTERRFRDYWARTEKPSEHERFAEVEILIAAVAELPARRPQRDKKIGKAIVAKFGDGKWHSVEAIAHRSDVPVEVAAATVENIIRHKTFNATAARKRVGKATHYQIFRQKKTVTSTELTEKLTPIIKGLMTEGKKVNLAFYSPQVVTRFAFELQKLLDAWSQ